MLQYGVFGKQCRNGRIIAHMDARQVQMQTCQARQGTQGLENRRDGQAGCKVRTECQVLKKTTRRQTLEIKHGETTVLAKIERAWVVAVDINCGRRRCRHG